MKIALEILYKEPTNRFVDRKGTVVMFCCNNLAGVNGSIHVKVSLQRYITHHAIASDVTFSFIRLQFAPDFSPFHLWRKVATVRHTAE